MAHRLFALSCFEKYDKILFILSHGIATDDSEVPDFSRKNVTVVTCYITNRNLPNPRRLYSRKSQEWINGAKFMFNLSSTITTQRIPRTLFIKRGWTVDTTDNQTRLFCQVNHPDVIDDVCGLARDVVCNQDALADVLSAVDLDIYFNKANDGFKAMEQVGETCYANAAAAVMHLAMKRIVGREGGYPDFFELRETLIRQYG